MHNSPKVVDVMKIDFSTVSVLVAGEFRDFRPF